MNLQLHHTEEGASGAPKDFWKEIILMKPKNRKKCKWGSKDSKLKNIKSHEVLDSSNHFVIFQ